MATVKTKFRASTISDREGILYFQIIHNRRVCQIRTTYRLFHYEWNADTSAVFLDGVEGKRRDYLMALQENLSRDRLRLTRFIARMERSGQTITAENIVEKYANTIEKGIFLAFINNEISHLKKVGRLSAVDKLRSTIGSFLTFYGRDDIVFDDFCGRLMEEYEGWLKARGLCMNTISFYMRTLRAVYNQAVEHGLTTQQHPFKTVYTGIDKTVKRAIPIETMRRIRDLNLASSPSKALARDLFMFSFYTRGMSFVDMSYLKKTNLRSGWLVYRRRKTNQQLTIKWERPMQEIVDRYTTKDSPYLLPIIKDYNGNQRTQYLNAIHMINNRLKQIGRDLNIGIPLTTYVARHGWASIAKHRNVPTATISEALGHDSEKTTRIYLASLDTSAVDRANKQILNLL